MILLRFEVDIRSSIFNPLGDQEIRNADHRGLSDDLSGYSSLGCLSFQRLRCNLAKLFFDLAYAFIAKVNSLLDVPGGGDHRLNPHPSYGREVFDKLDVPRIFNGHHQAMVNYR